MSATHREKIRLNNVHAFYGESHILHGIDLTINQGELVTLLGRNGSGRSTTLKTIMNLVGKRSGQIAINGTDAMSLAPHKIAHLGNLPKCCAFVSVNLTAKLAHLEGLVFRTN